MKALIPIILLFLFGLWSCTSASESDLIDVPETTQPISYTTHVKPIIDNNCLGCHSNPPINGAPMHLTTYDAVKDAVENRALIERISTTDQGFLMPFGGPRLPQQLIDIIIQWDADGLMEN